MVFFSKKNWDILNPKFQQNPIVYYFFFIFLAFFEFCFLFHLSKLGQKLWNFLWCFIGRIRDLTSNFWKILKVLLKSLLMCEIFFFQSSTVYGLVFIFLLFFTFYFQFCLCVLVKKFYKFLGFFYFMALEILSKNVGKSWSIFLETIDIWNPKFFINSIVYYLFF